MTEEPTGRWWRPSPKSRLSRPYDHDSPRPCGPHATRPVQARRRTSRPSTTARSRTTTAARSTDARKLRRRQRPASPRQTVEDRRDCIAAPRASSTRDVHFPQIAVIGAMGLQLLDWLDQRTLPEEARMADAAHARAHREALRAPAGGNGTTTALVFGAHFPQAQQALFEAARPSRAADRQRPRRLRPQPAPRLEVTPDVAVRHSKELMDRWHGHGRLRYAVTPRFSVSCTEAMLDALPPLLEDRRPVHQPRQRVARRDRVRQASSSLRPATTSTPTSAPACSPTAPCSPTTCTSPTTSCSGWRRTLPRSRTARPRNAFLASGIFPMARHVAAGVRFGMGTDVGAGTGPEHAQGGPRRLPRADDPRAGPHARPAHLPPLATSAGAEALGLNDTCGDLSPGKPADIVLLRAPARLHAGAVLGARRPTGTPCSARSSRSRARSASREAPRVAGEPVSYDQDEVVPVHGLFGRAREHLAHLGGLHAHHAPQLEAE